MPLENKKLSEIRIFDLFNTIRSHYKLEESFHLLVTLMFVKLLDELYGHEFPVIHGKWQECVDNKEPLVFLLNNIFSAIQKIDRDDLKLFAQDARNDLMHSRLDNISPELLTAIDQLQFKNSSPDVRYKFITELLDFYAENDRFMSDMSFRTPKLLREFMTSILDISNNQKIIDLTCGSGSLLFESYFQNKEGFQASTCQYFGIDINRELIKVATFCKYFLETHEISLIRDDILKNYSQHNIESKYDKVIMDPPFGIRLDPYKIDPIFKVQNRMADAVFLDAAMKTLNEGGMACVIVTGSILSQMANQELRERLLDDYQLLSVITLPKVHSGIQAKLFVMVFQKCEANTDVLFIESYSHKRSNNFELRLELEHSLKLFNRYRDLNYCSKRLLEQYDEEHCWFASYDDIYQKQYSLDPFVYKPLIEVDLPKFDTLVDSFENKIIQIENKLKDLRIIASSFKNMTTIDFEEKPLSDVCSIHMGRPLPREIDVEPGEIPWVQIGDMTKLPGMFVNAAEKNVSMDFAVANHLTIVPEGSLLFSAKGTLGVVKIAERMMCVGPNVAILSMNESNINNWYIFGWLTKNRAIFQGMVQGTIPSVPINLLRNFQILIPRENRSYMDEYSKAMSLFHEIKILASWNTGELDVMADSLFEECFKFRSIQ